MKIRLEVKYRTTNGVVTEFQSSEMSLENSIAVAEDLMKLNRLADIQMTDSYNSSWTLKELKKYLESLEEEPHDIHMYFDGGFDRKTMKSGLGCSIYYKQNGKNYRIRKNALVSELGTNNEAEYAALHFGLKQLEEMGVHHMPVKVHGDSKVVINQLTDEWPCLEDTLFEWMQRIEKLIDKLGLEPEYHAVSRKKNQETDQLATQALQQIEIDSRKEVE
ncbi:ribonuclease HI [Gracilibacillus ureilyticus]|uniref:Ribonuclease HI n=1 Tax=Gracilibacillus ureilyticus TaxID=531814 RepID=A0A1H9QLZ6_9BACI|nr:reverse transcriptase-like protein [Gracilibacillus ureilyticus]SER61601.1 ribonuclease HI [Gracilibacillus ureilyticus]